MTDRDKSVTESPEAGKTVWYLCNPRKNTGCPKWLCYQNVTLGTCPRCNRTSNPDFAVLDDMGRPIVEAIEQETGD